MFWRIQKFTPDLVAKKCGVYAVLIVSVLFNVALLTRTGAGQAANAARVDYASFAKQVTNHLFDANYMTVRESMAALPAEIPYAINKLKQAEFVPKDDESLEAIARELAEAQSVSNIRFDSVDIGRSVMKAGTDGRKIAMLPADVRFQVVVHDNERVQVTPFHLRYYLANATNPKTGETHPIVFDYEPIQDATNTDGSSTNQ